MFLIKKEPILPDKKVGYEIIDSLLVVILVLLVVGIIQRLPKAPEPQKEGAKILVIGKGYYNPDCYGSVGFWSDFFSPTKVYGLCSQIVPNKGMGTIKSGSLGCYFRNNCYRVEFEYGEAGWYPASSLVFE
jgi:hypothetical protein